MYVLEDWGMSTWYAGFRKVEGMAPYPDEEIVCLTMSSFSPPRWIIEPFSTWLCGRGVGG
ncbi:hypothetical protein [Streptomyces sp. H39-C1]|uniref:hypothetical protein n=1 Tax=Streptomyces sp. H39-C1 TaxID=3004355 RepID=UPI0022AEABC6|nr:hypothetical protein [Streptomyces sp. H39-C1]MCZ4103021.1 hypothetical protein [Streptomyces sp. H39-C1]